MTYKIDDPTRSGAVSARTFAERHGLRYETVVQYCRKGRIFGARLHTLTRKWWIYPPAKLLPPAVHW